MSYVENGIRLFDKMCDLWRDLSKWSDATFGPPSVRGPRGPLLHLAKEANEAADNPSQEEFADCLLCLLDSIRRSNRSLESVVDAALLKMEVNKLRSWPAIAEQDHDDAIEHIK